MSSTARVERQDATAARAPEPGARIECRSAPRVQASAVPAVTGVRLKPFGAEATMLNISTSGVLVECTSRIRLGTAVTTVFDGTFSPTSVEGRVARSSVAGVTKNGALKYHIGIAFNNPIAFEHAAAKPQPEATPQAATATTPMASPAPQAPGAPAQTVSATPKVTSAPPQAPSAPTVAAPAVFNRW